MIGGSFSTSDFNINFYDIYDRDFRVNEVVYTDFIYNYCKQEDLSQIKLLPRFDRVTQKTTFKEKKIIKNA